MGIGRVAMVLAVMALAGLSGCSKDGVPGDVRTAWEAYVAVLKSGDEAAARALFTEESASYFEINDSAAVREVSYRLVKVEPHESFYRLHVIEERQGTQKARFFYLVKQGDALRFEFPFILLASDWPKLRSSHITFHLEEGGGELYRSADSTGAMPDTAQYEEFVAFIERVTGIEPERPIDYYLCRDGESVSRLSGVKGRYWHSIGSCIVTARPYDFDQMAAVILRQQHDPIEFARLGLRAYGEGRRASFRTEQRFVRNSYNTLYRCLEPLTEDTVRFYVNTDSDSLSAEEAGLVRWNVAVVLFSELVKRDSTGRLAVLYREAHTGYDFLRLCDSLYGETPYAMLMDVKQDRSAYLAKTAGDDTTVEPSEVR